MAKLVIALVLAALAVGALADAVVENRPDYYRWERPGNTKL